MKSLIYSEFERLWTRKWVWLVFLGIPVIAYCLANYFAWINHSVSPNSMNYTFSNKLMFVGLRELLPIICNFVLLPFVATIFTEDYYSGRMRLLFIRQYSKGQIFAGKIIVLYLTILLLLLSFGICLMIMGIIKLPSQHSALIASDTLQQYALAFATLIGLSSLLSSIAMFSKNVTYSIGIGLSYIIIPLIFERLIYDIGASMPPLVNNAIALIFIPLMQKNGIDHVLLGNNLVLLFISIILIIHVSIGTWIAYRRFIYEDYAH
ncbi:ABC transporter permease [Paenibacillus sp. MMS20-IR301]|uniref:ABC transporter permease n=1 Tax=Paenibacillus sp. MMS20-IR301 TaxID=2895946 RepID=UPI0028E1B311|nr:ABC transporter permease [Paenibacillus sp. MMS20-IR301]WNS41175.1 ABC transporter permease [Paenibacillus sp. MMS20-IR301]